MKINISPDYLPEPQHPSLQFPEIHPNLLHNYNHSQSKKIKTNNTKQKSHSLNRLNNIIVANLGDTRYEIIERVCEQLGWKIDYSQNNKWDIKWTDVAITCDFLSKMMSHQKVNHFPGMSTLSRKNHLAKNLKKMQQSFPHDYMFFPKTFLLPHDSTKFKNYYNEAKKKGILKTFIVKPEASCQGRGIFLTQSLYQIELYEHSVVQKYIPNPLLYKGLKFDLRVYALVIGCDPLRIYIYNEGLVRFSTQKYQFPHPQNLDNLCMHLTNYAINKQSDKYVYNDSAENLSYGHKKSLAQFFQTLKKMGLKAHNFWSSIKDQVIKTMISGQPHLQHQYRISQPHNLANNMCYQILGFDFMIDELDQVYLLEVNHTPSFSTDTPLDELIKSNLIRDTLIILNINEKSKSNALEQAKFLQQRRVYTGKSIKLSQEQKLSKIKQFQQLKQQYQSKNIGSFQRIFPSRSRDRQRKYEVLLQGSAQIYKDGQISASTHLKYNQFKLQTISHLKAQKQSTHKFRIKRLGTTYNNNQQQQLSPNKNNKSMNNKQMNENIDKTTLVVKRNHDSKSLTTADRLNIKSPLSTKHQDVTMFSKNLYELKDKIVSKLTAIQQV